MIKAAFFDIDGTLLSHASNCVPPSTVEAIHALRQKGILVFLATGRHKPVLEALEPLRGLPFDGAVTLNGQYCYNAEGLLYHRSIDREDLESLLSHLAHNPLACCFVEEDRMYINFHNDLVRKVHAAIHTPLPPLGDLLRCREHDVYQVILYAEDAQLESLPQLCNTRITRWHYGGVDMIPASGGKAAGIRKVLEHYSISPQETIAFGDGENDIDMFHAVGTAVAMGNAPDTVKAQSSYVTDSVDDDGIFKALKHLGVL